MHRLYNLRRSSSEAVDLCRNENGSSTKSIWSSSCCHPGSVHRLNKPNCSVFYLLKLITELEFAAEPVNKQTWVDYRDVYILNKNLTTEYLKDLCNLEHVDLDSITKVNKEVGAFLNSTRHVQTRCCNYFRVSPLSQAFEVLLVFGYTGNFVVVVSHVADRLVDV